MNFGNILIPLLTIIKHIVKTVLEKIIYLIKNLMKYK